MDSADKPFFNKVAVLGLGLIGSSLCLLMKQKGLAGNIAGNARSQATLDTALEIGSATFTSTQLIKGLVEKGLSTNAARVRSNISPFLVHLKKGNFRTPGIFRLICELEDLDIINYREEDGLLNNVLDGAQEFKIPNNPPLRVTGRAVVPELEINEGEYQVYDEEDNYLLDILFRTLHSSSKEKY